MNTQPTRRKAAAQKKNGSKGRNVLEGALVGAILGVAAGMLMAPETGKKLRTDLKKRSADFYRYLAPRVKKLRQIGEERYNAFVDEVAQEYAKAKQLSTSDSRALAVEAKRSWKAIKKEVR